RRLGFASSASMDREMSIASTRLRPRVSVTMRSSPQRGPDSATAATAAASPTATDEKGPDVLATRAVASDQAAARRTRERRAQAAAAQTAPPITGARATTIGASHVIMGRALRTYRRPPPRAPARAVPDSAASYTPLRSGDTRDAARASSRAG